MNIIFSENDKQKIRELKKKDGGGTQSDIVRKAVRNLYRGEAAGEIRLPEGTKAIQISFLK